MMEKTDSYITEYFTRGGTIKSLPSKKARGSKTFGSRGAAWHRGHKACSLRDSGISKAIGGR